MTGDGQGSTAATNAISATKKSRRGNGDHSTRSPATHGNAPRRLSFDELFETSRLRKTWAQLRKELTKTLVRDCIDFAEFDLHTTDWVHSLSAEVISGTYQPIPPNRREESKSAGAFRIITAPSLRDGLVYRHICDYAYELARPGEWKGAFFSRRHRQEAVGEKIDDINDHDYSSFFEIWKRYAAYRETIGLSGMFHILVVTDLSNYFDSIQHELLYEHLGSLGIPRKALGVLGKLLAVLRPESGHSASPAVGLPTDEIDCSRTLAHIFLFEHDRDIASFAGSESYVRWMDDQNVGVSSLRHARMVVRQMVRSLSRQRLTLNSGKTKFLSPAMVAAEFWLDVNVEIDHLDLLLSLRGGIVGPQTAFVSRLFSVWASLLSGAGNGHWDKVAKRILLLAAKSSLDVATREQCVELLVRCPQLATRIFDYLVARDRFDDLVWAMRNLLDSEESLYEDVEIRWFESLLSASPASDPGAFLSLAEKFISTARIGCGRPGARVPAALLMYWFGDEAEIDKLAFALESNLTVDGPTRRTVTAILCARRPARALHWLSTAAAVPQPGVSGLIAWILGLSSGASVKLQNPLIFPKKSAMTGRFHFDARIWLRLELLIHSPRREVLLAVRGAIKRALTNALSANELKAAMRISSVVETRIAELFGAKAALAT